MKGKGPPSLRRGHIEHVTHRVLHAREWRRLAGNTHGDARNGHQAGELRQCLMAMVAHPVGACEQRIPARSEQLNHTRIKQIPHPEYRREVPVSRGREQGDQLTESSAVHVGRGVGDRLEVHDQGIGPSGRHGPLDAVADQHGHVVRERVDRDCRLDDDEGDATRAMTRVLADIGDRA